MRTANLIIATVSMIAVIGCGSTSIRCSKTIGDKSMQDKSEQVNSGEHGIKYFPDGVFSKRDDLNKWTTAWYSCELKAMNEPSLYDLTGQRNERIYRFLWLRSFHDPVVVRVRILDDGSAILIVKKADRMEEEDFNKIIKNVQTMRLEEIVAECNVGKIIDSTQKSVSREEVDAFLKIIKKANFWQLTSSVEDAGLDGSDWVVEGLDRGNYHLVDRWSPTSGGVREIGVFLLNLAGFTKEEIY